MHSSIINQMKKSLAVILLLIACRPAAQAGLPDGFSDRSASLDVLPGFINPPKGYGEVPFFWWQGDPLTRERLLWQLDKLENKGISSLQINYSHVDSGGLSWGLSNPSKPALFTEEWWALFKWFAAEAYKRGMTVSLSDYTLGIGQGFSMDEAIGKNPDLNGSLLKYVTEVSTGTVKLKLPENLLALSAFRLKEDGSLMAETRKDLLPLAKGGGLVCDFKNEKWKVVGVYFERVIPSYDPMYPLSGAAYIKAFFEKFEKALPGKASKALNFFFSDELNFRLSGNLWDSYFAGEFKKRKGYDVVPFLDALFFDIGDITPKIRLDYNDVLVSLSEENFFKPVYQWHQDRGMIYGCDHGGRGKDVAEFGDYFRTQRWNQGPGSDQPQLQKDIVKAKIAASIAHLYKRPRVWLEGFHSSGWGTNSAELTDAILANFVAGYNLLSLHGLYYSTQGGWWEWAPPDNHFRMPYWKQIAPLMACIQRLSYLLSQGYHKCDVAVIYPTEPAVAGMAGNEDDAGLDAEAKLRKKAFYWLNTDRQPAAFEAGERLYDKGIDFDYIDYESLARAEAKNGELNVSGEKYKVLVVPSMKAIRFASLRKIEEFKNAGGIIVNIGEKPQATEKNGANDAEVAKLVAEIFSKSGNMIQCDDIKKVASAISGKYAPDFKILSRLESRPYVMHRIIGKRDVYALYNFPAGSRCFFRAKGSAQLWNPWNGEVSSLSGFAKQAGEGTEITLPLSEKEIQLIIFDPENAGTGDILKKEKMVKQLPLDDNWEFELQPSLDNCWGDFVLPASYEVIGAQVRQLYFCEADKYDGKTPDYHKNWKTVTCGFGPQFVRLGALSVMPSGEELLKMNPQGAGAENTVSDKKYTWEEYAFSWKQGVEGDYGHQGYHGLKGEMYDDFIRMGALEDVKMSKKRVPEPAGNYYVLYTRVIAPADGTFDVLAGDVKPVLLFVNSLKTGEDAKTVSLKKGANTLLAVYDRACETYLVFRMQGVKRPEKQQVSMCWYGDNGVLPFDCPGNGKTAGLFAFDSAPGLSSLGFAAYGDVSVWVDGVKVQPSSWEIQPDGLTGYSAVIGKPNPACSRVVLEIKYKPGYRGAGAIPQYIRQQCGRGQIKLGDWSRIDGLRSYSGGSWYRKTVNLDAGDLKYRLKVDLGGLVSSAELFFNGRSAGIRLSPPWVFDVTKFARQGENKIEILVCNTIANNYTTVPTRYRGEIKSGLFGPVKIKMFSQQ